MDGFKHPLTLFTCLIAVLALAACGTAPQTNAHQPAPGQTTYQAPSAPFIQLASVTVKNMPETILTTAPGLTLYYFASDTSTTTACRGACTATWRPLMYAGTGTPIAPSALPGKLSLLPMANGNQVEYNGHPLYTYTGDTSPRQVNGEGQSGRWFVATANLPALQGR